VVGVEAWLVCIPIRDGEFSRWHVFKCLKNLS
jgi:hypothetical protein